MRRGGKDLAQDGNLSSTVLKVGIGKDILLCNVFSRFDVLTIKIFRTKLVSSTFLSFRDHFIKIFRILSRRVRVYRKREHLLFRLKVSAAWVNSSTIDLLLSPLPAVFSGDVTSCFRLRDIPQRAAKDTKSNTSVNWPSLRGEAGPIANRMTAEKTI